MNTALLIIDVQDDYFEDGAMTLIGSYKASENIKLLLQKFRTEHQPVVYIQHIATSPSATFFIPNTIGAEIHTNVKPLDDEKVVIKHYPNSFRETDLPEHLKSLDITNVVICGMMTHMCIDATTRAAKDLGFNCTLIADACATKDLEINGTLVTAENVHNSFLAALNYFYSTVTNTNEYIGEN
jgi:nicotinamidase-related amidase